MLKKFSFFVYAVSLMALSISSVLGAGNEEKIPSTLEQGVPLKKAHIRSIEELQDEYADTLAEYKTLVEEEGRGSKKSFNILKKAFKQREVIYFALIEMYPEAKIHAALWLLELFLDLRNLLEDILEEIAVDPAFLARLDPYKHTMEAMRRKTMKQMRSDLLNALEKKVLKEGHEETWVLLNELLKCQFRDAPSWKEEYSLLDLLEEAYALRLRLCTYSVGWLDNLLFKAIENKKIVEFFLILQLNRSHTYFSNQLYSFSDVATQHCSSDAFEFFLERVLYLKLEKLSPHTLHRAVSFRCKQIIKLLLREMPHLAFEEDPDSHQIAFHGIIRPYSSVNMIRLFLNMLSDENVYRLLQIRDENGRTAIERAEHEITQVEAELELFMNDACAAQQDYEVRARRERIASNRKVLKAINKKLKELRERGIIPEEEIVEREEIIEEVLPEAPLPLNDTNDALELEANRPQAILIFTPPIIDAENPLVEAAGINPQGTAWRRTTPMAFQNNWIEDYCFQGQLL